MEGGGKVTVLEGIGLVVPRSFIWMMPVPGSSSSCRIRMMIGEIGMRSNRRAAGCERALMGCGGGGGGRPGGGNIEMSLAGDPGSDVERSGFSIEASGETVDLAGDSGHSRRGVGGLPACMRSCL